MNENKMLLAKNTSDPRNGNMDRENPQQFLSLHLSKSSIDFHITIKQLVGRPKMG
jgi:hypothetical protein